MVTFWSVQEGRTPNWDSGEEETRLDCDGEVQGQKHKGQTSWVRLTENCQVDAFDGAGVELGVLGPTGVLSGV